MIRDIEERTPQWHAVRAENIGGSEIAALWGVQSAYQMSKFTLHHVKTKRIPEPRLDSERADWGIEFEPTIARIAARQRGWQISKGGYATDDSTPGMGCSLDYVAAAPGFLEQAEGFTGPGIIQIKAIDWLNWRMTWPGGEPTLGIRLQLQHELACSGFMWGAIPHLIGGNDLRILHYGRSEKIIGRTRELVTEFWADIAAGREPNLDGTESTAATLRAIWPEPDPAKTLDLLDHPDAAEICMAFAAAQADRLKSEKIELEAKNRLRHLIGDATTLETQGWIARQAKNGALRVKEDLRQHG
jgi:predicted phage-related endonuclease